MYILLIQLERLHNIPAPGYLARNQGLLVARGKLPIKQSVGEATKKSFFFSGMATKRGRGGVSALSLRKNIFLNLY